MKGTIISITNHKGGVAKTTTACNLGHALSRAKKKVLVVDMDLQCNTTSLLFGEKGGKYNSLYEILNPDDKETSIEHCIYGTSYENLYIIPNIRETAAMEQRIIRLYPHGLSIFRERFRTYAKTNFDITLIDNPPNLGTFVICSLMASDFVIVPNETGSKYSLEGLNEAVRFVEDIRENGNPDLKFLKVLLTKVDKRMMAHKATIAQIRNFYPSDKVFKIVIPTNTDIQKSEISVKTIFAYRSNATGAIAYAKLAKELLSVLNKK